MAVAGAEDVKFSAGFFDVELARSPEEEEEGGLEEIKTTKVVTLFVKSAVVERA